MTVDAYLWELGKGPGTYISVSYNPNQRSQATTNKRWKRAKREPKCIVSSPQWKHGITLSRIHDSAILYGNGVIVVPNVQAVMAWAAGSISARNEGISV